MEENFLKYLKEQGEDPELMYSGNLNLLYDCWKKAKQIGWSDAIFIMRSILNDKMEHRSSYFTDP